MNTNAGMKSLYTLSIAVLFGVTGCETPGEKSMDVGTNTHSASTKRG